jgi:hypothetical protein
MGADGESAGAYDLTVAGVSLRQFGTAGPAARVADPDAVPGEALLHPVALASIAVLLINDHVLKAAWPGFITGKLSDFAGLVFFPLLLLACSQIAQALIGRSCALAKRQLIVAISFTAALFVAIKADSTANELVSAILGGAQWLVGGVLGASALAPAPVVIARDLSDVIALPALAAAYLIGRRSAL